MGRFSSVQSFADNHNEVRKVAYEQISGTAVSSNTAGAASTTAGSSGKLAFVPPEKVVNPYSSTAGAGSGEFHIYRHSRNRELQRQKFMELSAEEEQLERQYQQQLAENERWEKERTAKRQKKRQRQKNAKKRKENLRKAGVITTTTDEPSDDDDDNDDIDGDGDKFQPNPSNTMERTAQTGPDVDSKDQTTNNGTADNHDNASTKRTKAVTATKNPSFPIIEIPKDGSFLETMKQLLQQHKS